MSELSITRHVSPIVVFTIFMDYLIIVVCGFKVLYL